MAKQFIVSYEIKGSRILEVFVSDKTKIPSNWEDLDTEKKDEWLYEHQEYSVLRHEDVDYGKAVAINQKTQEVLK